MIKKTITYHDLFTEEELTGDFYFNLTEVEVLEYMAEDEQGMDKVLKRIAEAPNAKAVLKQLKIMVRMATASALLMASSSSPRKPPTSSLRLRHILPSWKR